MTKPSPKIIEVTPQQLEDLLARADSNALREEDTELMRQILASYVQFVEIVGDKNATIARLRKLLFGSSSEKTDNVVGDTEDSSDSPAGEESSEESHDKDSASNSIPSSDKDAPHDEPPPGHGRYGADDYPGANQVAIAHPTLAAGDDCPECGQGTVYEKTPGVLVRFVGQSPLQATVYRMQKLRCHLCGKIFTAPVPSGVGEEKYDHTVASMIGLLKYGSGYLQPTATAAGEL